MADVQGSLITHLVDLDRSAPEPLYTQLYKALREAIKNRELPRGTRLPSTRELAGELGISRNTVMKAFDQLRSEEYVKSQTGSGTYVADRLPEWHTEVPPSSSSPPAPSLHVPDPNSRSLTLANRASALMEHPLSLLEDPVEQNAFRPGVPAFDAFPIETWSKLVSRRWRSLPANQLVYGNPAGYMPLREAVAGYLRTARGVRCEAEQVLITSGIQQAITLAARVLLNPDDVACVEDPCFVRLRATLASIGGRVHSVPVDEQGFDLSAAEGSVSPKMVAVTPSHQYPLGMTMSFSRRQELLEWSSENKTWILEDDYDSEFRYSGRPIAALQGMDDAGRVLYAGTFSKVLFPALRIGYLVLPPNLVEPFTKMRSVSDRCPPRVSQMVLADFINEGHFGEHLRQMRTLYAARQAALLEALEDQLGSFLDVNPSNAGLHLVGRLPKGIDDRAITEHLLEHDLVALPLSFYAERSLERGGLLLGYAAVPKDRIRHEVRRMADLLEPFRS